MNGKCHLSILGLTHSIFHLVSWQVKEEMLFEALTTRKTVTVGEKLIVPYKLAEVTLRCCIANNKYRCSTDITWLNLDW